ncbi:MAG: hypothetical protein IPO15_16060 [Anaerolineae bacterium]|nr:hypothetical protein [Anaerolineae bacterium]
MCWHTSRPHPAGAWPCGSGRLDQRRFLAIGLYDPTSLIRVRILQRRRTGHDQSNLVCRPVGRGRGPPRRLARSGHHRLSAAARRERWPARPGH